MRLPILAGALLGAACAPRSAPETMTAVEAAPVQVATGTYSGPAGVRDYRLTVPAAARPLPLVVMLHGCAQDPAGLAQAGRLDSLAAEFRAIVLAPEQPASANPLRCWNWFLPGHQARDGGEPAIIAGLARHLADSLGADRRRISIGGLSAGGAMAVLTALAYPDLFAAVGSHSGVGWRVARDVPGAFVAMRGGGLDPAAQAAAAHAAMGSAARMVPLIAFTGTADTLAVPAATEGLVRQFVALHGLAAPGAGLTADTARVEVGGYPVEVRRWADDGNVVVEEWVVAGLAHALSGGDPAARWTDARGPDAAREMLEFLLAHPLPPSAEAR